jgi:hypothetical protein
MFVNRIHKPYHCRICKKATGVKACKCQRAYYCSRNCQKIDWNEHKSNCHFKLTELYTTIHDDNRKSSTDPNNSSANEILLQQQQQQQQQQQPYSSPDIMSTLVQQQHYALARERREYDPTPLQYQQQPHDTYTENTFTTTPTHSNSTSSASAAVDEFEENLFNSLMYSVVNDDGAEQEILKNLNIRADDLLATYSLDSDISSSLDGGAQSEYAEESVEQTLDDKIFTQETYEFKPETQRLLAETKETLEKELSLFRENNLQDSNNAMQLGTTNPKYVTHTRVQDNNTTR